MTPHDNPTHEEKMDAALAARDERLKRQREDLARFREIVAASVHGTDAERAFLAATLGDASRRRGIHLTDEDQLLLAVFSIFIRPATDETQRDAA